MLRVMQPTYLSLYGSMASQCRYRCSARLSNIFLTGGGYGAGQGNQDTTTITSINNNSFVSVVIQYRLGAFGFLAGDEVHRFGNTNAGLLDQHFALQWIQQHITKFGGDPRQVTIAGESAGGGSVMLQAMAYGGTLATRLFENVIAASPYLPMQYPYNAWQPSQAYYAFAAASGCFPGRAYGNTSTTILDCLRNASSAILQQASAVVSASGTWGTWAFVPVTDGHFITQRPSQQLIAGKVNGKRVMSGNNAMEGAAFVIPNITTTADFESWLRLEYPLLSDSDMHKILHEYYPASNTSSTPYATCGDCNGATAVNVGPVATGPFQRAINLYSETTFVCPSYWLAEAYHPKHGKQAYKYQYSIPAAQHGADLNAEGLGARSPNISPEFVSAFTTMWGNMITKGDPSISAVLANGNGSVQANDASDWPLFSTDQGWKMMNLNETGGVEYSAHVIAYPVENATQYEEPGLMNEFRVVDGYKWEGGRGKRCEFWRSVSERVPE